MSGLRASAQADSPFCSLKFVQALEWNTRPSVHCLHICPSGLFAPNLIVSGQSGSSFPIPILLDCSPFPHPSLLHLSGQALPSPFPSHLRGWVFHTRFLCALPHANFRNARSIGLSQRLPNKLFCIHFHSTSRKSLHSKPERADAAQTMSRFC